MHISTILDYSTQLLQPDNFKDYCPNGLQVAGAPEITKIVTGVTASMALLEAAVKAQAQLILVHHGYFWRGEDPRIIGIKQKRLKFLLAHDLNLMAYHLPLDAHKTLGNNVQLAQILGFEIQGWAGEHNIIAYGTPQKSLSLKNLLVHISQSLDRPAQLLGASANAELFKPVRRIAWCTGAAQGYFEAAIALGVDVFISGEVSEQTTHLAEESGVAYIAAGHHATERYGVQALGAHLAEKFSLNHSFIDCDNPV